MNTMRRKHSTLWIAVSFFALIGALFNAQVTYATNTPSDFVSFVGRASSESASKANASRLYEFVTSGAFDACREKGSYSGGVVQSQDAPSLYASFEEWTLKGAENTDQAWVDKSYAVIKALNGVFSGGAPTLERQADEFNPGGTQGTCELMLEFALDADIPIRGTAVVVDSESEKKAFNISQISIKCTNAFSSASAGGIALPTEISRFLGNLSDSDYDSKVNPNASAAAGGSTTDCETIATNLKDLLMAAAGPKLACTSLGYASGPEYIACTLGFNNKDNSSICKNTYGDNLVRETGNIQVESDEAAELAACLAGATGVAPEELETTSCTIDGIGWMVCPLMNALGGFNDLMYGWIEGILVLNPLQMNNPAGEPTPQYQNWQVMRDIANVLLVIVFLIVIFSQATSFGISNYGVKKMLPRIVMIAIAINISYFIMMLAVDLVNLIGVGLNNILNSTAVSGNAENLDFENVIGSLLTGTVITVGGFALAGVAAGGFGALALIALPFVVVAGLALLAAVATLFLRNALVIVLVVIAPLALVAYLLPNTENLFDKWRKLFISMLMLFPMAALLFGGAKFAAYIILTSNEELSIIAALFIMAAPLGALPWLLSQSNSILAGVNNRLQGLAKSAKSPLQNALKPAVSARQERYRSGAANVFGRGRGTVGADGIRRDANGREMRRTIGQRFGDDKRTLENEAEGYKHDAANEYTERALTRNDRGSLRARHALDHKETAKIRSAANDAAFQERLDERIGTAGSIEQAYSSRASDLSRSSATYQSIEKQRQAERVQRNEASTALQAPGSGPARRLGDMSRQQYAADEATKTAESKVLEANLKSGVASRSIQERKASELGIERVNAQEDATFSVARNTDPGLITETELLDAAKINTGEQSAAERARLDQLAQLDPRLVASRQRKENAELQSKTIQDEQKLELENRKRTDASIAGLVRREDAAARGLATETAEQKAALDQAAELDPALVALRRQKENAEARSGGIASDIATELKERTVTDPELAELDLRRRANDKAAKTAEDESLSLYADEVTTAGSATQVRAAGTINPIEGAAKAAAYGIDARESLRAENVKAYTTKFKADATPDTKAKPAVLDPVTGVVVTPAIVSAPGDGSLMGVVLDPARTSEEQEAALRAIVNGGNIDAIAPAMDHVFEQWENVKTVMDSTGPTATTPDPVAFAAASAQADKLKPFVQSIGETIASSPGRSAAWGAGEISGMKAATYRLPGKPKNMPASTPQAVYDALGATEKNLATTLATKGIDAKSVPKIDKRDLASILKLAQQGILPPDTAAAAFNKLDVALSDPDIYVDIKDREAGYILRAMDALQAAAGGGLTRRTRDDTTGTGLGTGGTPGVLTLDDLAPEYRTP